MTASRVTPDGPPLLRLGAVSIDCDDPARLADFYCALLDMQRIGETPDGRVVAVSDGTHTLAFMHVDDYRAPSWPQPGQLQQMHLDISVTDLDAATERAAAVGARQAEHQPAPDSWRVFFDPAGHPFCLTTVGG
jgi:catechol 2,3-dioxygenase-like lactoylglutathione lyase family enzyme